MRENPDHGWEHGALPRGYSTFPVGVVGRTSLKWVVPAVLITAGAAFVMVPPFPEPSALITSDYAALQARLGPPAVVFGDKFVGWSRPRYVATWTLEAGLEFPLRPQALPAEIHRCLWIRWAGYSILCRWSYAVPVRSKPARRSGTEASMGFPGGSGTLNPSPSASNRRWQGVALDPTSILASGALDQ